MLERLMGDERLLSSVVDGFLSDIPLQIDMMRNFFEAGDLAGVERQAHQIKGACANVSAEEMRRISLEIERAGKLVQRDLVPTLAADLSVAFAKLQAVMRKRAGSAAGQEVQPA